MEIDNKLPDVARLLGVKMDERFMIGAPCADEDERLGLWWFEDGTGFCYADADETYMTEKGCNPSDVLISLIAGTLAVYKQPMYPKFYKPRLGNVYYTFSDNGWPDEKWHVKKCVWERKPIDYALRFKGWCYRTQMEAEDALPAEYEKAKGKKWENE